MGATNSRFDDTATRAEAICFGRYLTGAEPTESEAQRYVKAVGTGRYGPVGRDEHTLERLAHHPRLLGVVDGGLALRRPQSAVRQRLLLMAAILEASPEHADRFMPTGRSPFYVFYVGFVAARAAVRGVIGAVLVTWI